MECPGCREVIHGHLPPEIAAGDLVVVRCPGCRRQFALVLGELDASGKQCSALALELDAGGEPW